MAKIEIYTKPNCPYCIYAKELLDHKGAHYSEIRLDQHPEKITEMLARCDGRRTVPQIIINDKAIGGFDDLKELEQKGLLSALLK